IRATKIRDDDSLICADVMFDTSIVLIYTKRGEFIILQVKDIVEQAKDSMGLMTIRVPENDSVVGMTVIANTMNKDPMKNLSVVMISDKGMTKIVDSAYLGDPGKRS